MESSLSGIVTLDGQPMKQEIGIVTFHPVGGGSTAQASIASDGHYEVKTGRSDGLPAGEYLVTVIATDTSTQPDPTEPPVPGPLLSPLRYTNKQNTDLKFTIESGVNIIDIPLKSQP